MKNYEEQLADHYAAAAAGTLRPFEEQLAEAQASGRPWRDVRDWKIGQGDPMRGRVIIYLDDAEIEQGIKNMEWQLTEEAMKKNPLTTEQIKTVLDRIELWKAIPKSNG